MSEFRELLRKQLDRRLEGFRDRGMSEIPRGGWVRTIRKALGMSSAALGKRVGVTQSAVSQLEASESAGTITVASLQKLARGLQCELVYAFVPVTSLDEIIRKQAHRRAERIVETVSTSMDLENQRVSADKQKRQIDVLAKSLIEKAGPGFWDEP